VLAGRTGAIGFALGLATLMLAVPGAAAAPGDLYVADNNAGDGGAVFRVDPVTGAKTPLAIGPPFDLGPEGITVDRNGTLLVADDDALDAGEADGAIFRVDPATGALTTVASGSPFLEPFGIDVAPNGQIILADEEADALPMTDSGSIFRVDPASGAKTTLATGPPLIDPVGVAITPGGDQAFIVDDGAGQTGVLYRLDLATGALTPISSGAGFDHPTGVALSAAGQLYVTDQSVGAADVGFIWRIDPVTGARTPLVSGLPLDNSPHGIAEETTGQFVIADGGLVGEVFRMPPTGGLALLSSGEPFDTPSGIAVAPPICRGQPATIMGTDGNDALTGSPFPDVIATLGGRDTVDAAEGDDVVCAGAGRDRAAGGSGRDRLFGEAGRDKLFGQAGRDKLVGGKGKRDRCTGGKGRDRGKGCERGKL
jgi:DNA-binding beta-propeller fold protein YncE